MRTLTSLTAAVLLAASCNEDELVQLDPNSLTPATYFSTQEQVEAPLFASYGAQQSSRLGSRLYFFINDLRSDEVAGTQALFATGQRLTRGEQLPTDGEINEFWTGLYRMVHHANTALEGFEINRSREEALDEDVLSTLTGEARFLRGWAYNELATHFGDVPLYMQRVTEADGTQGRAPRAEVMDFAQADLAAAADLLPDEWEAKFQGRATRGAALGILARSHMQEGELAEARAALETIIEEGNYALVDDYGSLFTEENDFLDESLYEIVFSPIGGFNWNGEGVGAAARSVRAQEYGPNWHNVQPTQRFVEAFSSEECGDDFTDPRLAENVLFRGDTIPNGDTILQNLNGSFFVYCDADSVYASWYKYGVYYKETPGGFRLTNTNLLIMRYADVLLLLAEIEARQGDDEAARSLVNQVRERAGVPALEDESGDELLFAVQHERFVELGGEQVRFRDLQRWRDDGILPDEYELSYYQPKDRLLPIPQSEIVNNPNISVDDQNPGY